MALLPTISLPKSSVEGSASSLAAAASTVKFTTALRELIPSVARSVCDPKPQAVFTGIVISNEPLPSALIGVFCAVSCPATFTCSAAADGGWLRVSPVVLLAEEKSCNLLSNVSVMLPPGKK